MKAYRVFWFSTVNGEHCLYSEVLPAESIEEAAHDALTCEKLNPVAQALSVESTEGLHEVIDLTEMRA